VHGSKDRVKDASRITRNDVRVARAYALWRMRDDVPLLGVLRTSAVIGAPSIPGGYPRQLDGPTEAHFPTTPREECRLSGSQDAFHRHGHEGMIAKGWLPPAFVPALSLTPPTLCSQVWGQCFDWALQGHRCGHPRSRDARECRRLCCSLVLPCLGLTIQARHRGRPTRPSTRTVCLARTDAGRSA
jgi:hypothetical protein